MMKLKVSVNIFRILFGKCNCYIMFTVGEEDISTLGPNMLLYRAAAAHNLPVMCHAIAIGADKNWKNPNDNGRTCLFQAILSVTLYLFSYKINNV